MDRLAEITGGYFTTWPQRYASAAECGIKIPVSEMMSRVSPPREAVSRRIVALLLSLPPAPPQRDVDSTVARRVHAFTSSVYLTVLTASDADETHPLAMTPRNETSQIRLSRPPCSSAWSGPRIYHRSRVWGAGWPSSRKAQNPMPGSETERSMDARRGG
jgi:hypothetical protein